MARAVQDGREVACAGAGAVVGDQTLDVGDAVAGEERPGVVDEPDGGAGFLVGRASV